MLRPQVLDHVQADEILVRSQSEGRFRRGRRWLYLFSAICVTTRLWLGGLISTERSEKAARPLAEMVRRAALPGPLLVVVDGLRCYKEAFEKRFRLALRTGRPGRPRLLTCVEFALIRHVKARGLVHLACGTWDRFIRLWRQVGYRVVSTSYIERLNATFRERLAVLGRRTRHLARTRATLEASLYLLGAVYNFCSAHGSLGPKSTIGRTPAMAAGLTQHVWTVGELLWHRIPPERWRPPVHRGPLSKREQALLAQWGECACFTTLRIATSCYRSVKKSVKINSARIVHGPPFSRERLWILLHGSVSRHLLVFSAADSKVKKCPSQRVTFSKGCRRKVYCELYLVLCPVKSILSSTSSCGKGLL